MGRAVTGADSSYHAGPLTASASAGFRHDYRIRTISSDVQLPGSGQSAPVEQTSVLNERDHRYVVKAKGWRIGDIDGANPRPVKDVLRDVAANNPQQPVRLSIWIASGTPVSDIAGIVGPYAISQLSLSAYTLSGSSRYFVDFSSTGPAPERQLDRAECQLLGVIRVTGRPRPPHSRNIPDSGTTDATAP